MHEEQGAGQVLPGTSGGAEALPASGVLPLEASSADSQVSPPFARKFLPLPEFFPGTRGVCVCARRVWGHQKGLGTYGNALHTHTLQLTNLL